MRNLRSKANPRKRWRNSTGARQPLGYIVKERRRSFHQFPRVGAAQMSDVTDILDAIRGGDRTATDKLLPLVYEQLRQVAAHKMARERPEHTLQPTALVHEAWLRLVGSSPPQFNNRTHFFAAAGEAMRRILVESARRRQRLKHGGGLLRVEMDAVDLPAPMPDDELLALNEALDRLATLDERASEVVNLCFFIGLTQEQAASELGVSVSTVERLWTFARTWLFREIRKEADS